MLLGKGIKGKLLRWCLFLSLVPLLSIGYFIFGNMRQSFRQAVSTELSLDAVERETVLVQLLDAYQQRHRTFAAHQILQDLLIAFNRNRNLNFKKEVESFLAVEVEEFHRAARFDRSQVVGKNGKVFFDTSSRETGGDLFEVEEFQKAIKRTFVEYRFDPQGRPHLIVTGPVFPHSIHPMEAIGVLTLTADIDETERLLLSPREGRKTRKIYLMDRHGRAVVSPRSGSQKRLSPEVLRIAFQGGPGIAEDDGGLIAYRYIREIDGALFVRVDRSEAFAPLRQLENEMLLAAVVIMSAGTLMSLWLARSFVDPLQTLCQGVERIKTGDWTTRLQIKTGDEIEGLADRFNQMADEMTKRETALSIAKESYRSIFECAFDIIILVDPKGMILQVNEIPFREAFDYDPREVIGNSTEALHATRGHFQETTRQLMNMDRLSSVISETVLRRRNGEAFDVEIKYTSVLRANGEVIGRLLAIHDITARKKAEKTLIESNKALADFKFALDQSAIVAVTDQRGIIQYVNDKFCEISKYAREELIGQDHRIVNSGYHSKEYIKNLWRAVANGEVWRGEFRNRAKDGALYWVDTTIVPFLNDEGKPFQYLSIRTDITKRKETEEHVHYLAQHDGLTGLPNRALLLDRLNQALAQARWRKRPVAVFFLDLDRFKLINDTLGHSAGDRLLQSVAKRLTLCLHEGDTVARLGGDEFVLLLPDIAKVEDVVLVAEKALNTLKQSHEVDGREVYISGSIGISLYPNDGEDAETLLKNADIAMYRAKERKSNFILYSSHLQIQTHQRLEVESALRHALERKEFLLHYQPQIDLGTGKVVGVEALLRWELPGRGLISPMEFIPLAEETGLIIPIGEWLFRAVCAQNKAWQEAGLPVRTWVNVSARQFQQQGLMETLAQAIKEAGSDPDRLGIELTETLLMKDIEAAMTTLYEMRSTGVHVAVDDFGTGYSSLNYLRFLPVNSLKIDRSFVCDIPDNQNAVAIVDAIITLAHNLKLKVVAEGVETEAQLTFLQARRCDEAQGYLFCRPMPEDALTTLLAKDVHSPLYKEVISCPYHGEKISPSV